MKTTLTPERLEEIKKDGVYNTIHELFEHKNLLQAEVKHLRELVNQLERKLYGPEAV